ncbi:MAG: hypothetical protein QM742_01795 [Aquabacterium sp.]
MASHVDRLNDSMSAHVADIESHLHALEQAFASGDSVSIEAQVQQLQRSLADSLVAFRQAEHAGIDPLSPELRSRLKLAQARVQAQQVAVHRAAASIDRTLGVLLPRDQEAAPTYGGLAHSPAAKAIKAYR